MLRTLHRATARLATNRLLGQSRFYAAGLTIPGTPRTLQDVTNIDMLQKEEPVRIGAIWEAFHDNKDSIAGATIDPEEASSIVERGTESPNFVYPLRRDGGHFMLFSQFSRTHKMFVLTFLEEYQRSPEMAQPWASIHLFDELLTTKGVALLRAEVASERLTTKEAEHLLLLVRRYYGSANYDKVYMFNHSERHFDLGAYLAACP